MFNFLAELVLLILFKAKAAINKFGVKSLVSEVVELSSPTLIILQGELAF